MDSGPESVCICRIYMPLGQFDPSIISPFLLKDIFSPTRLKTSILAFAGIPDILNWVVKGLCPIESREVLGRWVDVIK